MRKVEGGYQIDGITAKKRKRMMTVLWRLERHDPTNPEVETLRRKLGVERADTPPMEWRTT